MTATPVTGTLSLRMPALDRYIEALARTPGAQSLTIASGSAVELVVDGTARPVGRTVPTSEQVSALLVEVMPEGFLSRIRAESVDVTYRSPYGPVIIRARADGDRLAARIAPAPEATGQNAPALPRPDGMGFAASGPAVPWGMEPPAPYGSAPMAPFSPQMPAQGGPPPHLGMGAPGAALQGAPLQGAPLQGAPLQGAPLQGAPLQGAPVRGPSGNVDDIFHAMLDVRASDLHVKPGRPPFVRIDGEMIPLPNWPVLAAEQIWALIQAITPDRNRAEFQELKDTDFAYELRGRARLRCNVFEDVNGVGGVFRHIPAKVLTARDLGLPPAVLKLCDYPKGLVLVTGPTGSGKSTTLAAMIDYINDTRREHIITIEDPVEFVHVDKNCLINQRQVGSNTMSFKNALRAALREDPDVVLVGELRDLETTAIAIETAETGHLVFGTLHTNTAPATVDRIINQFPADRQAQIRAMLSESLIGVISQTLCRKRGGGRVAALEILIVNSAVANLVREAKTFQIPSIMQTSRGLGMQTLNDALLNLVKAGLIEPAEAYEQSIQKKDMGLVLQRAGFRGAFAEETA